MKFAVFLVFICLWSFESVLGDKTEHTYGDDIQGVVYGTEFARVKLTENQHENATCKFTFPKVSCQLY